MAVEAEQAFSGTGWGYQQRWWRPPDIPVNGVPILVTIIAGFAVVCIGRLFPGITTQGAALAVCGLLAGVALGAAGLAAHRRGTATGWQAAALGEALDAASEAMLIATSGNANGVANLAFDRLFPPAAGEPPLRRVERCLVADPGMHGEFGRLCRCATAGASASATLGVACAPAGPARRLAVVVEPIAGYRGASMWRFTDLAGTAPAHNQAARAPEPSAELFRRLFESAPIGIALIDRCGAVERANGAAGELFGRAPADLIGQELAGLLRAEDRDATAGVLSAAIDGQPLREPVEIRIDHPQERSLVLYLSPMGEAAAGGSALYFIDVTGQKSLEAQFAQSQKMQAVGQLAGGVAHDFNNLLTAMIGFCDLLLLRSRPGDPAFGDIMQIKQNADRAGNLVRQLLAFSRQQPLQPRILDVTDVLVELSHMLRRLIGETIELEVVHARDLGLAKVDQGQLEQVIINLAVNARDAMPQGGRLTIRTANLTQEEPLYRGHEMMPAGDYVVIEVADTGIGIPADHLPRIFEPFFSTKETGVGTGLGLSTVYGIVRQTGGFVFVDSSPGRGTQFRICLPRCAADLVPVAGRPEPSEPPAMRDLTGSATLMLVEDDDPVRIFSARALRNKGYHVTEATSAAQALELLSAGGPPIDLLITDVAMPQMDGPGLVREVRAIDPTIKVVFISGYAEDAFRQRLDSERDIHFLAKPFSLKQLASKVKEVIQSDCP
ncbi:MAG TPA: ATP-binding protein [Stellaceae bacterium]